MRFHFTSFAIGVAVGAAGVVVGRQLRPVFIELAAGAYQVLDGVTARIAVIQEDWEDLLAEARMRARGEAPEPEPERATA